MGRWFGSEITQCPNCGVPEEDTAHLLHCPDTGRSSYFRYEAQRIQSWLLEAHTDPVLGAALGEYIASRGSKSLSSIVGNTRDVALLRLVHAQDAIGWDQMMEGKVTLHLSAYQRVHLVTSSSISMSTAEDWMNQFLKQILHITHGQWIYRNVSRHHKQHGLLKDIERQGFLREIDHFLSMSPEDVPEESRFLLEINFHSIRTAATEHQSYWVHAMKAAVKAGRRTGTGRRLRRRLNVPLSSSSTSGQPTTASTIAIQMIPFGDDDDLAAFGGVQQGSGSIADKSNKRHKPD